MKNTFEFKTEHIKNLAKRKNYLLKKYKDVLAENIPKAIQVEMIIIDEMLASSDVAEGVYRKKPSTFSIKNSQDEEWYFQQMSRWIERHPDATDGKFWRGSIYKFALHFFVENIALNTTNATLSSEKLTEKVKGMNQNNKTQSDSQLIQNIENMTSLLLAMQQKQFNYIPERIDEQGMVQYAISPMTHFELEQFGFETEINPNKELSKVYVNYKKIRSRDKQLVRKINQKGGTLYDD
ncbi:hypothetical protein [Leuconostoc citreum]|uniref:hypothetical protein n=1 Tax=Leuconostoc citreum TaxID=33964 RepID=UPI0032DE8AEE